MKSRLTLEPEPVPRHDRDVIKRVVVPLDGSPLAASALMPARSLAAATSASLLLLTTRWDDDVSEARASVEQQAASLGFDRVETVMVHDRYAPEAILIEAADPEAVVCMATHGRSGVGQAILGSVAEAVVRDAKRPVLLVGPHLESGPSEFAGGKLLVPVDGSPTSEAVIPVAAEWTDLLGLRPWLVQVLPTPLAIALQREVPDVETGYVRGLAARLPDGAMAQWHVVRAADPADALVTYAATLPATLLAMATHGRTGLARVALGSVAMHVVHRSPCPVLVIRPTNLSA